MYERKVKFRTITDVKDFCQGTRRVPCDVDIVTDHRHVVDAKSIMGIFSLDLSRPVTVRAISDDGNVRKIVDEIIEATNISFA